MKAAKSQTMLPVAGTDMLLPVTELTGAKEGETITLSAGVHSREYAGVQALTELRRNWTPDRCGAQSASSTAAIMRDSSGAAPMWCPRTGRT